MAHPTNRATRRTTKKANAPTRKPKRRETLVDATLPTKVDTGTPPVIDNERAIELCKPFVRLVLFAHFWRLSETSGMWPTCPVSEAIEDLKVREYSMEEHVANVTTMIVEDGEGRLVEITDAETRSLRARLDEAQKQLAALENMNDRLSRDNAGLRTQNADLARQLREKNGGSDAFF